MIAIIGCESCDTRAIEQAFDRLGADAAVVRAADRLERASGIVIPTGASFPRMIRWLRDTRLVGPLLRAADDGRPILGISLGMHALLDVSYDGGQHTGLGLIHGKAIRLDPGDHPAAQHSSVPHEGWSRVRWTNGCPLAAGLRPEASFYFRHAFHAEPLDRTVVGAHCSHGIDFAALVWQGRIFGVQFLPEASEDTGRTLLANFVAM